VKLGQCYNCSWSSCYDDIKYFDDLVEHLDEKLCIDQDDMIMSGASNGGMFTYHMMGERPTKFKGYFIVFGQPQLGYLKTPLEL